MATLKITGGYLLKADGRYGSIEVLELAGSSQYVAVFHYAGCDEVVACLTYDFDYRYLAEKLEDEVLTITFANSITRFVIEDWLYCEVDCPQLLIRVEKYLKERKEKKN